MKKEIPPNDRMSNKNPNWRGGKKINSICKNCGKKKCDYVVRKYCSKICSVISPERRELQRKNALGNKNHWKGDVVGYQGVHAWLRKKYGKPNFCEHCKIINKKMYHWANISKNYKRKRNDWLRLCVPCHMKYDGITKEKSK